MYIYHIPYTYLIGWSELNLYYYGSQYSKKCNPNNLFNTYFTSSKTVHNLIKTHGLPDIIEIRKVFTTKDSALIHEHKVLRRLNAKNRKDFLNKSNGRDWKQTSSGFYWVRNHEDRNLATKAKYIKNGDEIPDGWFKGFLAATETQKEATRNTNHTHTPETINRIREANKGILNHSYGKKTSEEIKAKIIKSQRENWVNNKYFTGYWMTPYGSFMTVRDAVNTSEYKIGLDTMNYWCKTRNNNIISINCYNSSNYLNQQYTKEYCVGKTFKELGFGFHEIKR